MTMNEQNILQGIMIGLLLAVGYLGSLRALQRRTSVRGAMPAASLILLVFFGIFAVILFFVAHIFGMSLILMAMLLATVLLVLCGTGIYLAENFRQIHVGALMIFILYVLVILSITLFFRNTNGDHTTSLLRMDVLREAMHTHSLAPIRHILQNVALFIPIGFLLPYVDKDRLNDLLYPLLFGLALSVLIESTQFYFDLGQADLTDIVANVLGTALGYMLFWLGHRMGYSMEDEE